MWDYSLQPVNYSKTGPLMNQTTQERMKTALLWAIIKMVTLAGKDCGMIFHVIVLMVAMPCVNPFLRWMNLRWMNLNQQPTQACTYMLVQVLEVFFFF